MVIGDALWAQRNIDVIERSQDNTRAARSILSSDHYRAAQGRWMRTRLTGVLLVLCMGMVVPGCTTHLQGVGGPIAWQVTDLRVVARSAAGTERDIYAFTLGLAETQGAPIPFTQPDYTASQPGINTA